MGEGLGGFEDLGFDGWEEWAGVVPDGVGVDFVTAFGESFGGGDVAGHGVGVAEGDGGGGGEALLDMVRVAGEDFAVEGDDEAGGVGGLAEADGLDAEGDFGVQWSAGVELGEVLLAPALDVPGVAVGGGGELGALDGSNG